jgi:hypothetical protein
VLTVTAYIDQDKKKLSVVASEMYFKRPNVRTVKIPFLFEIIGE